MGICKNTKILLNQQDTVDIQDISSRRSKQIDLFGRFYYLDNAMSMNINRSKIDDDREDLIISSHIEDIVIQDNGDIYEIFTRNRRSIRASEEQLFLIKFGNKLEWKKLADLKFGDMISVYPYITHLSDNVNEEYIILTEEDIIKNIPSRSDADKILNDLKDANLLPLSNKNPKLNVIARLCGFNISDGHISDEHEHPDESYMTTHVHTTFSCGSKYSVSNIYNDIKYNLGIDIGEPRIDTRERKSSDNPDHRPIKCTDIDISSKTIYTLFKSLELPIGKKTIKSYHVPKWIHKCSNRTKQEFLA